GFVIGGLGALRFVAAAVPNSLPHSADLLNSWILQEEERNETENQIHVSPVGCRSFLNRVDVCFKREC
ncbi:MAG: hypothetical protein U9P00_10600, partial [Pseudomonadota bacterium]|nr:hypothetical protein [Pseudomonadota bacterium]